MTTTIETITTKQIKALATEAGEHGDNLTAAICARAIGEDHEDVALESKERAKVDAMTVDQAREACVEAIRNAEAQCGTLRNHKTGAAIRSATASELEASREAAERDGGAGVIEVNGIHCYVEE